MHKTHAKRKNDIKTKLMAAICMLLVSSIMMVTTTYAWFTLSTAPEVTGINTAVGANGNLEMALLPKDGQVASISSAVGDSVLDVDKKNVTWGNLVDLSDSNVYGLDKITLYPSALSLTQDGKVNVLGSILETPQYGADGRVSELAANSTVGYFDAATKSFTPNEFKGVRAVGTASGMTERQLSYRNARSAANTAKALAANLASQSLNANGSSLANIAIQYGMDGTNATFVGDDVVALRAIIDDLLEVGGVLDQLETAYMQYILAFAASAGNTQGDTVWQAVSGAVTADGATLSSVINTIGENNIPDAVKTGIAKYNASVTAVTTADSKLKGMETTLASDSAATFTWDQIREAMAPLADPTAMLINGFKASEVKANLGALVSSVTEQGGLKVIMATGAGVYADIADQSGDFTASITIEEVNYNGVVLNNMKARMETKTSVSPTYLTAIGTAIETLGAPEGTGETTLPISDMYGYIIDLAFRTNAAESKLLLQQDGVDRIYGEDNTNEETKGHGATMTFMATTTDFGNDQVKALMDAIKIIFFDPMSGTIYCYGGLDTANATVGADGVTAKIYLYNLADGATTTYTAAAYAANSGKEYYTKSTQPAYAEATDITDTSKEYYTKSGDTYTKVEDNSTLDENNTYYVVTGTNDVYTKITDEQAAAATEQLYVVATAGGKAIIADNAIMPLTQNTATALSVLVYLDGENITNAHVAATGSTSMTGKMNLQFASSANLVPMEYADLYIPGGNTNENNGEAAEPQA